jgi:hypothetical protein
MLSSLFTTVDGYRAAYARLMGFAGDYFGRALAKNHVECLRCGRRAFVCRSLPSIDPNRAPEPYGLHVRCPTCAFVSYVSLSGLVISTPDGQRFCQEHPCMRTLPEQEIEAHGRPAIVSRFQSASSVESLTVTTDAVTFMPLQVHWAGR